MDVVRAWRTAATEWRQRVSVTPAVGHQPTRVYVHLSHLPGVVITTFHPIQTDPPLAHALFAIDKNVAATQAFTRVAIELAEKTDSLAAQVEIATIDSSKARLLAAALRRRPVLVAATDLALADDTDLLAKRLEAKALGPAHPLQSRPSTAETGADAQHVSSPFDFYGLALATLDDAKSLITFRRSRAWHPEWEQLARTIPHHLVAALDEWEDAKREMSLAQHEYEEALHGTFYNEWIEPSRRDREETVRMLAARVECATARLARAVQLVNETQKDRALAENSLAEAWLRSRGSAFATRFDAYRTALAPRIQAIEASRNGAYELRAWKDTCACAVLRQIGEVVLQVADDAERKSDWWGTYCLSERFNDLDHDAWRDLRIDVRQEAAKVREIRAGSDAIAPPGTPERGQSRSYEASVTEPAAIELTRDSQASPDDVESPTGSPRAAADPASSGRHASFRRTGARHWHVSFGGERATVADSLGMDYLCQLLACPGLPMHVWKLRHGTEPPPESIDTVVDDDAIDAMRKEIDRKQSELAETTDLEARTELEAEVAKLRRLLSAATTGLGDRRRPRRTRTEAEKARELVGKAIRTALEAIRSSGLQRLHEHLCKSLKVPGGMNPLYAPDESTPWTLVREHSPDERPQ